jgi:hypothetical protein
MGTTNCGHDEFVEFMSSAFKINSYDSIRKNCNSFSDIALHFLLRKRLPFKFRCLEYFACPFTYPLERYTKYERNRDANEYVHRQVLKNSKIKFDERNAELNFEQ